MRGHSGEAESLYTEASEVIEEMGEPKGASDALEKAAAIRRTLGEATTDTAATVEVGEDSISIPGIILLYTSCIE